MKTLVLFFILFPCLNYALSFVELVNTDIPGVSYGSLDWGDFDNDGFLDLLITGNTGTEKISRIYKNNGDNTFTYLEHIPLTGVVLGEGKWVDFNNNGLLDIAICGHTNENEIVTKLYENDGVGNFTELADLNIPGVFYGTLDWVDFNNNGWLDLFITGESEQGLGNITRMYENNGDGTFTWREDMVFPGFKFVSTAWGDINGNGYSDLVICGRINAIATTQIYLNDSGNGFILQQNSGIIDLQSGSAAWGDYDGDGWLDLLITGNAGATRYSRVYRNNGDNTFTHQNQISLTAVNNGGGIWADLNNNGLLDIIICGSLSTAHDHNTSEVYLNNGDNTFTELVDMPFGNYGLSALRAVDLTNNGKLDLSFAGLIDVGQRETSFYSNEIDLTNTPPSPPTLFSADVFPDYVFLSWNDGTDIETSPNNLSYNIWLQPLHEPDLQLMAPMADLSNGFRKTNNFGNAGFGNAFQINALEAGFYNWAIQTVDSANTGSAFSPWQQFYVPPLHLSPPENLVITGDGYIFHLSWDPVLNANQYEIFGTEDPESGIWHSFGTVTEPAFNVYGLYPKHFFRVVARFIE